MHLGGAQVVLGGQFGGGSGFQNSLTGVLGEGPNFLKCLGWALWGWPRV